MAETAEVVMRGLDKMLDGLRKQLAEMPPEERAELRALLAEWETRSKELLENVKRSQDGEG